MFIDKLIEMFFIKVGFIFYLEYFKINQNFFFFFQKKGHEHLHNYIAISLIIVIFTFQFVLWYWKKNHLKSFKRVTLFGVWIVPPIICYIASFWRMLFFWLLYTIFTLKIFLDLRVSGGRICFVRNKILKF